MFNGTLKFDFLPSEYMDHFCEDCGKKTVHVVRTKELECTICGNKHD